MSCKDPSNPNCSTLDLTYHGFCHALAVEMPQQITSLFQHVRSKINRKVNTRRLEVVFFYPEHRTGAE